MDSRQRQCLEDVYLQLLVITVRLGDLASYSVRQLPLHSTILQGFLRQCCHRHLGRFLVIHQALRKIKYCFYSCTNFSTYIYPSNNLVGWIGGDISRRQWCKRVMMQRFGWCTQCTNFVIHSDCGKTTMFMRCSGLHIETYYRRNCSSAQKLHFTMIIKN